MTFMLDLLLQNKMFQGIQSGDISAIIQCLQCSTETYAKGSYLYLAELTKPRMGILLSGKAKIIKETYAGESMMIAALEPGDLFGETFACVGLETAPVSILALDDSSAMFFDVQRLTHTCQAACPFHQQIIANLLTILAAKNMALNKKMSYITNKTIRGKLQAYLYDQADQARSHQFTIPFNRNELADYLCIDRSAMSRELSKMQEEGLLTYHKNSFKLTS